MPKIGPLYKNHLVDLYKIPPCFSAFDLLLYSHKDEGPLRYRKDPRNGNLMQLLGMRQRERRPKACLTYEDGVENPLETPIASPENDTAAKI